MGIMNLNVYEQWALGLTVMLTVSFCGGFTDPRDGKARFLSYLDYKFLVFVL